MPSGACISSLACFSLPLSLFSHLAGELSLSHTNHIISLSDRLPKKPHRIIAETVVNFTPSYNLTRSPSASLDHVSQRVPPRSGWPNESECSGKVIAWREKTCGQNRRSITWNDRREFEYRPCRLLGRNSLGA